MLKQSATSIDGHVSFGEQAGIMWSHFVSRVALERQHMEAPPTGQDCNQETAISANRLNYDISMALELDGANNVNSCKDIVVQYRKQRQEA
jgi:hypothetical protein